MENRMEMFLIVPILIMVVVTGSLLDTVKKHQKLILQYQLENERTLKDLAILQEWVTSEIENKSLEDMAKVPFQIRFASINTEII